MTRLSGRPLLTRPIRHSTADRRTVTASAWLEHASARPFRREEYRLCLPMSPQEPPGHTGGCLQPVLLRGRADYIDGGTGELIHRYTTVQEPGGVLPVACKTRRASRCGPCAEVYRADIYQLIRAGLSGGKDVPATVADHPCVFVTLTAPSSGPVHAHREKNGRVLACQSRRKDKICPHELRLSCGDKHDRDDHRLGEPLCADCYDYTGAVLFNACAPEMWRRFTITLRRTLTSSLRPSGRLNRPLNPCHIQICKALFR
jgi:hypothetical protein